MAIIFNQRSSQTAKKFISTPPKSTIFDIRGPFGQGLGITRHTSGQVLLSGQGTEALYLVDFVDYLTRFYIYQYATSKKGEPSSILKEIEALHDDFKYSFSNGVSFNFYLSFDDNLDFESLFRRDFSLLSTLENEIKLGVFGKAVVRVPKVDSSYAESMPGVEFTQKTLEAKSFAQTITSLGLEQALAQKKVEKVIVCGQKAFSKEWVTGLQKMGLENHKINSL